MNTTNVTNSALVAGATILVLLWVCTRSAHSKRADKQSPKQLEGLRQIYPDERDANSEFDIIAIHGLDTTSDETWTWRDQNDKNLKIDWLKHPDMLRANFPKARIFTYDWPAQMFKSNCTIQRTPKELARLLLQDVASRDAPKRQILFIASCLGGLILIEALATAAQSGKPHFKQVWNTTGGIIFLATPFRGTSFENIARAADPFLRARATLTATVITELLNNVEESTSHLQDLVSKFTEVYGRHGQHIQLQIFYETKKSNVLRKVLPSWLADILSKPKVLVNSDSARLQIVAHPIALERTHIMMNKFRRSNDADYERVVVEIDSIRRNLRLPADTEILENSYTPEKLRIERLSGQLLTMDKCYINLAIVEDINESGNSPMVNNIREQDYHLSLLGRLSVEEPDEDLEVLLSELFNKRGNQNTQPRRILIRGRAGVGKTTLCKKIVHDFKNGTLWPGLFDRLLWVPLRNLKQEDRKIAGYSYGHLFHHEYFSHHLKWKTLTEELLERVNTRDGRTLFLLDGLDEVLRSSKPSSDVSQFIKELLNKDDVIITSRPYSTLYPHMHPVDLELETIGFYPDQVQDYLRMSFPGEDNGKKLAEIRLFLEEHQLLQGLLRIPIQLDAFCYTWEDVTEEKAPQTMTAVYQAVEKALWKKDFCRLKNLPSGSAQTSRPKEMERHFVKNELALLEVLAFAGLYSDVVNYEPIHQDAIAELEECNALVGRTDRSLYETLAYISFIRTPNSTSSPNHRTYHFIHLTFQEYFAARYFVRQWKAQKPLNCQTFRTPDNQHTENYEPTAFLQRHKYNARYDIMWRFVAGLLVSEPKPNTNINCFFDAIVKEPRDLLGPAHYRLIMHCLHEVTREGESEDFTPLRAEMEGQLQRWLPPEYAQPWLVGEVEFPHRVINNMLEEATEGERWHLLRALLERAVIHLDTTNLICRQLRENNSRRTKIAVICIVRMGHHALLEEPIPLITDLIKDDDCGIRAMAIQSLGKWPKLPAHVVSLIAGRIKNDTNGYVRWTAVDVLAKQQHLPEQIIQSILGWLTEGEIWLPEKEIWLPEEEKWLLEELRHGGEQNRVTKILDSFSSKPKLFNLAIQILTPRVEDSNENVRLYAIKVLGRHPKSPSQTIDLIARQLEDGNTRVKRCVISSLAGRRNLQDHFIQSIARQLKDDNKDVRKATIEALVMRPNLPNQVVRLIVGWLEDSNEDVRHAAIEALASQLGLPDQVIHSIADRLGDISEPVRNATIEFLRRHSDLPHQVIQSIADRSDNIQEGVRRTALDALGTQDYLLPKFVQLIADQLGDSEESIRYAALRALRRTNLPDEVVKLVADRLDDDDNEFVRIVAREALGEQSDLPEPAIQSIMNRIDDSWKDAQLESFAILERQPKLSEQVIQFISNRLNHTDTEIRHKAAIALTNWPGLQDRLLLSIKDRLDDIEIDVKRSTIYALACRTNLPDHFIELIAARLDDTDERVRSWAIKAFWLQQTSLPEKVIPLIAGRLDDIPQRLREKTALMLLPQCGMIPKRYVKSFHRELRKISFWRHISWVIHGTTSYITVGAREIPFNGDLDHLKSELGLLAPQQQGRVLGSSHTSDSGNTRQ